MRILTLTEGAPPVRVALPGPVAQVLTREQIALVTPTLTPGEWDVSAGRRVGVARVGGLQVSVEPKLPVARLVFLMGYARDPAFWRDDTVTLEQAVDFAEALAESFLRQAHAATGQGLLQGYRTTDETLPLLRGRLREAEQLRRWFGRDVPLEVRFDDYTVDIVENRMLLAAALHLLRLPRLPTATRQGLQRLRMQFADVTAPVPGSALPRWHPSRLNARYHTALRLAEIVLAGESFDRNLGDVEVSGFMFDMWRIFEDFVCGALREAMARFGGRSEFQFRTAMDVLGAMPMRPDFVWSGHREPEIVVDAKYKSEDPSGFVQSDLYQMLAYCTVLGIRDGHLIYAQGMRPTTHQIRGADVLIHCHALDFSHSSAGILEQVENLAASIYRSRAAAVRPLR